MVCNAKCIAVSGFYARKTKKRKASVGKPHFENSCTVRKIDKKKNDTYKTTIPKLIEYIAAAHENYVRTKK